MPESNNEVREQEEVEAAEGAEEAAEEGKKGKPLLVWLLPLILMPAVGGAYFAYTQYTTIAQAAVSAGLDVGFAGSAAEEPIEYGQFKTIEDLLINPAGSDGKRFLVVSLGLETKSADVLVELEQKDIVVRDAVLRLLSERTAEELAAIEKRGEIKAQILEELNTVLQTGTIERLYFTQFLLQ